MLRASVISLARALNLLARVLVPLIVLSALGLAFLHLLYLRNPDRTNGMRYLSIDHFIVLEQVQRAAALPAAKIAFFGDSSCLMGIDPPLIERVLDLHAVESFCSIGFLGPAGYAQMLAGLIERNAAPNVLVLMFHPAVFRREPAWEGWPAFVKNGARPVTVPLEFPRSGLDYVEFEWLGRLIYSPLPGAYGLYYGSEAQFRSAIRARQGAAVDPSTGLNVSSVQALHAVPTPPSGTPANFGWNQAYKDALNILADTIRNLPPQTRVFLVVSPVPDSSFRAETEAERTERVTEIAAALGIGADHILKTPETMFAAFFSGYTHLNRWGQSVFTSALAKELASKMMRSLPR
jgi:hypothetical protein